MPTPLDLAESSSAEMWLAAAVLKYFLLPYSGVLVAMAMASRLLPSLPAQYCAFVFRFLTFVLGILVCATYGIVASIFLRLVGQAGLSQWTVARSFHYFVGTITGMWFEIIDGREYLGTRPAVYVGNHQTYVITYMPIHTHLRE